MFVHGRAYPASGYVRERDDIIRVTVAANYFATMGIPLVAGRGFTDRDDRRPGSGHHQRSRLTKILSQ